MHMVKKKLKLETNKVPSHFVRLANSIYWDKRLG